MHCHCSLLSPLHVTKSSSCTLCSAGVGWLWRKLAKSSTPHQEWTRSGDSISVKTSTSLRTHTVNFELGKEFDETRIDGEVSKARASPITHLPCCSALPICPLLCPMQLPARSPARCSAPYDRDSSFAFSSLRVLTSLFSFVIPQFAHGSCILDSYSFLNPCVNFFLRRHKMFAN